MQFTETNPDRPDFSWLTEESALFLTRGYLLEGVSPIQRIRQIADTAEQRLQQPGFADKFYHYMARGYYSLASPIWSNYGLTRGLPISCFGSYVPDSVEGIMDTLAEIGVMSKVGGGTSAYFGAVRHRGAPIRDNGTSNGSKSFLKTFESVIDVVAQGTARRGMMAGYIDIAHPDAEEWLNIHTEGDDIQLMYYGLCVSRQWLNEMKAGDADKRALWAKVIDRRSSTGIPYLFFTDNANEGKPDVYKDNDSTIYASNLCTEIMLPSKEDESFVCCLSSMNLLHYEEWKETDAVETLVMFLDTVMEEFIDKSGDFPHLRRARKFAQRHRALGMGVLGWHSYLISQQIPYESYQAMQKNAEIFKLMKERAYNASKSLAERFGEPEVLVGYGRRNTTLMSVAPTKSSSFILGSVSPSIEPLKSNYYVKDLAKVKTTYKNPFLEAIAKERGFDTPQFWQSVLVNNGSVQHCSDLTDQEKEVFKTFNEISPQSVIQQAAQRQAFIDQGQSLNIAVHPDTSAREINALYLMAEELGIKSLYYQFSESAAQKFNRELQSCKTCEG